MFSRWMAVVLDPLWNLFAQALTGFICVFTSTVVLAVDYKDAPLLEPFPLTETKIQELIVKAQTSDPSNEYALKGLRIFMEPRSSRFFTLRVDVDPQLNLWRGRPNDLASAPLGKLNIVIERVENTDGVDLYDAARDKPWSALITVYHLGDQVFQGSRDVYLKSVEPKPQTVMVHGLIKMTLPVNFKRYVVDANVPDSANQLLGRPEISAIELANGLAIRHPDVRPDFQLVMMGFDAQDERLSLVSMGSAGRNKDNHWYRFSTKENVQKMLIFVPEKFITVEHPFSVPFQVSAAQ
ncbi:MAG: hypothetical protein MI864_28750 [Pseudomonadales bacterium]|nr:hypothetical protein [Pseudomonadales bacterium]